MKLVDWIALFLILVGCTAALFFSPGWIGALSASTVGILAIWFTPFLKRLSPYSKLVATAILVVILFGSLHDAIDFLNCSVATTQADIPEHCKSR